jgi:hypothetical protein
METKTKICTSCKEDKPLSAFGIMHRNEDGRLKRCKKCVTAQKDRWKKKKDAERNEWADAFIF